jgi:hypothetical protein
MSDKPLVAAFDLATSTGVCLGVVGEQPRVTTWDLRTAGPSRSRRLLHFSNMCDELFRRHDVIHVRYEAPLSVPVLSKIGTNEGTVTFLRSLVGILEACAARADIKDIQEFNVQDARQYLTGQRTFRKNRSGLGKNEAKERVMKMARALGVQCHTYDEADAVAGWYLCCGQLNPRLSITTTPLFAETA